MQNNNKVVYIVHCVDTEGPMYESINDTFDRINTIFQLNIDPSKENLKLIQNKEMDLKGKEDAVSNLVNPQRIQMNKNWAEIENMLGEINSRKFRYKLKDSGESGWKISWFCMDHVGFTGINPRHRDIGHHNIFDYYNQNLYEEDIIQWHYHPLPFNGNVHGSGNSYLNSSNVWEILSRKIIDRNWFPSVFRPGFHSERPDSHWFLEQWIPFDYGNQSMVKNHDSCEQPDLKGRFGNWSRAPTDWGGYNPDHDDYQQKGNCKRWIFRCLNMEARLREIKIDDFLNAFENANNGKPQLISFTNHDFRDMRPEIDKMRSYISTASTKYKDVKYFFVDALTGARNIIRQNKVWPKLNIKLTHNNHDEAKIEVINEGDLFGTQPYLAIKTLDDRYLWDNFDTISKNRWSYTFDWQNILPKNIESIGVAGNSKSGNTEILAYNFKTNETVKRRLN